MSGKVLVIGGPTAAGKSALAMAIAQELAGEIINADASQLYRELPALTAQPDAQARAAAPHRLYGVLGAVDIASAQSWRALAVDAIDAAHRAKRLAIVVGGSGLYLRALLQGFSPVPAIDAATRHRARALWAELGPEKFRHALTAHDPAIVARLKPADGQRHMRAMEVWLGTGRALSSWQAEPLSGPPPGLKFATMVLMPPRDWLWQRIEQRFRQMVVGGALAEVAAVQASGMSIDLPAFKALGFRQLVNYLNNKSDLNQAIMTGIYDTRHYAKRQTTWFKHQIITDLVIQKKFSAIILPEIFAFIRHYLLTPLK